MTPPTRVRRLARTRAARTTAIALSLALLPLIALSQPAEADASTSTAVIERAPGSSSDDAEQRVRGGTVALDSSDLELTTDGGRRQRVGLRFTDIAVPRGAEITAAWVQFQVDEVSGGAASLRITGQAADAAPPFTGAIRNVSSRARTSTIVDWTPPPWRNVHAAGPRQRTPDLSAVIGEIVDRPGWAPGNALALFVGGTGRRTAEAYDGSGGPTLHIEYVGTGAPSPQDRTGDFPTRAEALARPTVVTAPGLWTTAYRESRPPAQTTYDLRSYVSTAYPASTLYATSFGSSSAAVDLVTVGGTVLGQVDRRLATEVVYENYAGDALRVAAADRTASYDLRVDNVVDGYNPRVAEGTEQDNTARFLLDGAYMTYIRDNAVEDDNLMSGTIRDSLFDGVFNLLSAKPSSSGDYSNLDMVVTLDRVIARLQALPDASAPDGTAHNKVFKWAEEVAGSVVVRDSIFYLEEVPEGNSSNMPFPTGVYEDVTVILGRAFDGDRDGDTTDLDYPAALPAGVTQTRDISIFTTARDAWLTAHGYR